MLVLPMLLMFVMPKMMNAADEETKKVSSNRRLTINALLVTISQPLVD